MPLGFILVGLAAGSTAALAAFQHGFGPLGAILAYSGFGTLAVIATALIWASAARGRTDRTGRRDAPANRSGGPPGFLVNPHRR